MTKGENEYLLDGLNDISELIGSGLFQLDNETENEMLECEAITMDVQEMHLRLGKVISFISSVRAFLNNNDDEEFQGHCPKCDGDDLDNVDGGVESTMMHCYNCGHDFGIESKGWKIS